MWFKSWGHHNSGAKQGALAPLLNGDVRELITLVKLLTPLPEGLPIQDVRMSLFVAPPAGTKLSRFATLRRGRLKWL